MEVDEDSSPPVVRKRLRRPPSKYRDDSDEIIEVPPLATPNKNRAAIRRRSASSTAPTRTPTRTRPAIETTDDDRDELDLIGGISPSHPSTTPSRQLRSRNRAQSRVQVPLRPKAQSLAPSDHEARLSYPTDARSDKTVDSERLAEIEDDAEVEKAVLNEPDEHHADDEQENNLSVPSLPSALPEISAADATEVAEVTGDKVAEVAVTEAVEVIVADVDVTADFANGIDADVVEVTAAEVVTPSVVHPTSPERSAPDDVAGLGIPPSADAMDTSDDAPSVAPERAVPAPQLLHQPTDVRAQLRAAVPPAQSTPSPEGDVVTVDPEDDTVPSEPSVPIPVAETVSKGPTAMEVIPRPPEPPSSPAAPLTINPAMLHTVAPQSYRAVPPLSRASFNTEYTLPPLKALPAEYHRKSKGKTKARKGKEKDKSGSKQDDWTPAGVNNWHAMMRTFPIAKKVGRATKCLFTRDWNVSCTVISVFSLCVKNAC